MKPCLRLAGDWQKLFQAPHVPGAPLDQVACHGAANGVVIVRNLEWSETLIADPQRFGGEFRPAQMALQPGHERHA
jgi:hypothetical protein